MHPADLAAFVNDRNLDQTRAYNLFKEAVVVLTMAQTDAMIARNLRMNSVSPAAVGTGILDDCITTYRKRVSEQFARVGRAARPEEVTDVIVFLAGPQSSWIKGIDVAVDGGVSALTVKDKLGSFG